MLSWMQAEFWADVAALGDAEHAGPRFDHGVGARTRDEFAADELRPALSLTRRGAETCFGYARDIRTRLPAVWAATAGRIDRRRSEIFSDETERLSGEPAQLVVDRLLPKAGPWTTPILRRRIRELVLALAPEEEAGRYRDAVARRRIWGDANDDGTVTITGDRLPTIAAAKAMARFRELARQLRAAGDPRNLDELAADLYLAMLNGEPVPDPGAAAVTWEGKPAGASGSDQADEADQSDGSDERAEGRRGGSQPSGSDGALPVLANSASVVELTVPLTTLMGLAETPGSLRGWRPIVADIARQFVRDHGTGQWRWTVTDPETGRGDRP